MLASQWRPLAEAHRQRVEPWVRPRLERRRRGERHPVDDFLFDYYSFRPGQLLTWHPGIGTVLEGSDHELEPWASHAAYRRCRSGVEADPARLEHHRERLTGALRIMAGTQARPPRFGCFGLHEWAMVYRMPADEVRHGRWPLRLGLDEVADVVDAQGLSCTHFDAFRFYSAAARPLNPLQLTRDDQLRTEQPGCLHATMDVYRWAFTASPFVPSDLVAEAFELARDVRDFDMRSSPYDLRELGLEPIPVETADGRTRFAAEQRALAGRGTDVRARLIAWYEAWVGAAGTAEPGRNRTAPAPVQPGHEGTPVHPNE